MPYWVKRILLKSGELVTERELAADQNKFDGPAPVVGEIVIVICRGREFKAQVVWGNWQGRDDGGVIVPIRVQEL